jgi:hypothetical protein
VRDDDKKRLLMGRSILKSRWLSSLYYSPDGYLGVNDSKDKPTPPVDDDGIMDEFCKDFDLQRKDQPGLSIVVPYIETDINSDNITKAVVEDYFYPILKGDLSVTVETETTSLKIDALSLSGLASSMNLVHFAQILHLAQWALAEEKEIFELKPCGDAKPAWSNDLIPSDAFQSLRTKFENGDGLAIKANLNIRQKGQPDVSSYFVIYLKQGNNDDGRPIFVREGIIISDVKPPRSRGVLSLVIVEDKPLGIQTGAITSQ